MARSNRFTIYDMMEQKGVFDNNPANSYARDHNGLSIYEGPQEYPKMLYHPEGKERITKQAEAIATPFGPKMVGEERVLISQLVANVEEEKKFVAQGWLEKPRDAIMKRAELAGEDAPNIPESVHETEIDKLKKKIKELEAQAVKSPSSAK